MKCNFTGVAKAKRQCRRQKCFLHCLFFMPKRKDIILRSLNGLRTRLISENRYTDAVDELLVKFANAKKKKFKIKIVEQMAVQENVTEQLKANNQMEWIARMNNIQSKSSRFCLDIFVFIFFLPHLYPLSISGRPFFGKFFTSGRRCKWFCQELFYCF